MDVFKNYIDSIESVDQKNRIVEIFSWIRENFPNLGEVIKWNQPMFTDHDTFIIGFSITKHHMSFTPEDYSVALFLDDIEKSGYEHTKGIVKIKWTEEIDYLLLRKIIQFNIADKTNCKTFFRK